MNHYDSNLWTNDSKYNSKCQGTHYIINRGNRIVKSVDFARMNTISHFYYYYYYIVRCVQSFKQHIITRHTISFLVCLWFFWIPLACSLYSFRLSPLSHSYHNCCRSILKHLQFNFHQIIYDLITTDSTQLSLPYIYFILKMVLCTINFCFRCYLSSSLRIAYLKKATYHSNLSCILTPSFAYFHHVRVLPVSLALSLFRLVEFIFSCLLYLSQLLQQILQWYVFL